MMQLNYSRNACIYLLLGVFLTLTALHGCGGGAGSSSDNTSSDNSSPPNPPLPPRPPPTGMEQFPLMEAGPAPGASGAAYTTAQNMGRGINLGNMFDTPLAISNEWGVPLDPNLDYTGFVNLAAVAGFSHIRLPVRWSNHASPDATAKLDEAFARRVDAMINTALQRNLYVVLDMHHYRQLDADKLDINEARVDNSVVNIRFLNLWRQIAARYKDYSEKLLFELYNEPHGALNAPGVWNDLLSRALREVRQLNPNRIVIIGPNNYYNAHALDNLVVPNDANLIFSVHSYEPFNFTHQGVDFIDPRLPTGIFCCDPDQAYAALEQLDAAATWSNNHRYPIYLGEFGANDLADVGSRINYNRIVRDGAEARHMPWAYWELASGFGIYNPYSKIWYTNLRNSLLQ